MPSKLRPGNRAPTRSQSTGLGRGGWLEETVEFAGNDLGPGQWNEVAGVNDENFGLGNQSGCALCEGLRHSGVLGAVENQSGNCEVGQHAWNGL